MPETPLSKNLEPFDYGSEKAHEIMRAANAGTNSRTFKVKMDLCSQGVIYRGELWFWCHKVGYQRGPWSPTEGRPALHHVIWEEYNGREVPASHVVVFLDGNKNNFSPKNLALRTRNDLCRQNQAATLFKKSRQLTALLLNKSQHKTNASTHTFTTLQLRSRKKAA